MFRVLAGGSPIAAAPHVGHGQLMDQIAELAGPHAAGLIDPRLLAAVAVATLLLASGAAARIIEGFEAAIEHVRRG